MPMTTIKVTTEVRDRLNAQARRAGVTVGQLLDVLVAEREIQEFFDGIAADIDGTAPPTKGAIAAETQLWEQASADGLTT
jgi:hypothetical protein